MASTGAASSEKERDPALTEAELKALLSRIDAVKAERQRSAQAASAAEMSLAELQIRIAELTTTLRHTETHLADTRASVAQLKQQRAELEQTQAQQKTRLAQQLRAAHAAGRQDLTKLLLNQQDPNALGRQLAYYGYLSRARSLDIGALSATLSQLQRVEASLFSEIAELDALKNQQSATSAELSALKTAQQAELAALNATLSQHDKRLHKLQADAEALEVLLGSLRSEVVKLSQPARLSGLAKQQGQLSWPVSGTIATAFGQRGPQGLRSTAVRFAAPAGREVRAIQQGRVVFADYLHGYGLVLIVDHGEGWMSLYGQAEALQKRSGDWVEPGEPVASTGQSAGQEGTGLYFEIRHNGTPVDPALYCRR